MNRRSTCIALGWLLLSTMPASAQALVSPVGELPIRSAPPAGFFQGMGAQVETAKPDETYTIQQQVTVPTITGGQVWSKIQQSDGNKAGWVYSGPSSSSSTNLVRK